MHTFFAKRRVVIQLPLLVYCNLHGCFNGFVLIFKNIHWITFVSRNRLHVQCQGLWTRVPMRVIFSTSGDSDVNSAT